MDSDALGSYRSGAYAELIVWGSEVQDVPDGTRVVVAATGGGSHGRGSFAPASNILSDNGFDG